MKLKSVFSKIGVGISLSMAVTFSNAALTCKDVEYGNDNYGENMETLTIEARLIDGSEGYFNRNHESVISALCEADNASVEEMIDMGYVRRSEVEGMKEVLGLDNRSTAGRNYEYAYIKLINEVGLSTAGSSNAAHFYAYKPNSECGKLTKRALAGNQISIKKLETEDSICTSGEDNQ